MRDWKTIYNDNTNCSANRSASLSPFALRLSFFLATLFFLCAPFPIHFGCFFSVIIVNFQRFLADFPWNVVIWMRQCMFTYGKVLMFCFKWSFNNVTMELRKKIINWHKKFKKFDSLKFNEEKFEFWKVVTIWILKSRYNFNFKKSLQFELRKVVKI